MQPYNEHRPSYLWKISRYSLSAGDSDIKKNIVAHMDKLQQLAAIPRTSWIQMANVSSNLQSQVIHEGVGDELCRVIGGSWQSIIYPWGRASGCRSMGALLEILHLQDRVHGI